MKFVKNPTDGAVVVPSPALKVSGMADGKSYELHTLKNAVILLKKPMTALELIRAADSLHQLSVDLIAHLTLSCGNCDDCEEECPYLWELDSEVYLPDELREEAGIPEDVPLCCRADAESGPVTVSAAAPHDIRNIPSYLREMFIMSGICLEDLRQHLIAEDCVYGDE